MKNIITKYFEFVNLEKAGIDEFLSAYDKLFGNENAKSKILEALEVYEKDYKCDLRSLVNGVKETAKLIGVNEYTANALTYILMLPSLKKHYESLNYSQEILKSSVKDVYYHIKNCKNIKGVWGTFTDWHAHLWNLEVFGFGRLQIMPMMADFDFNNSELVVKKGQTILDIHIPRTETPLDEQECEESYKLAVSFFKDKLIGAPIVFRCSSWLLFEKHYEILKPTSNIYKFIKRFKNLQFGLYNHYRIVSRLFDMDYTGNPDDLPADSSLRREYIKLIKNGENLGYGTGYFNYQDN